MLISSKKCFWYWMIWINPRVFPILQSDSSDSNEYKTKDSLSLPATQTMSKWVAIVWVQTTYPRILLLQNRSLMPSQENGVMDIGMGMSFTKYPMNSITAKLTVTALQIWKHSRKTYIVSTTRRQREWQAIGMWMSFTEYKWTPWPQNWQ